MPRRFLTAEWRNLVMLNYEVPADLLLPRVPRGVELDLLHGKCLVSMVGFQFRRTRVLGLPIPFHVNFPEINLRYYVRRVRNGETRRGVVFLKEIVPKHAIARIARLFYNEPYIAHRMAETVDAARVQYGWRDKGRWNILWADITGEPALPEAEAEAAFIAEHYWGYCGQRDGTTLEYEVKHKPWRVWNAVGSHFDCDIAAHYGGEFLPYLSAAPTSAFVAEGSPVEVWQGERLRDPFKRRDPANR